jgi:transcriptional regulator with XRE-family HTH domain
MSEQPNYVDVHVGRRIRERRRQLDMSQQALGDAIEVSFQQIQKYERGSNRVSASTLWAIAEALDVPMHFFWQGLDEPGRDFDPKDHAARARYERRRRYGRELPAWEDLNPDDPFDQALRRAAFRETREG